MTNLANASAVIYHSMRALEHFQRKPINWAGFYLTMEEGKLLLGPFQGKVRHGARKRETARAQHIRRPPRGNEG